MLPRADVEIDDFSEIDEELVENLAKMEPFGNGNPEPVLKITRASVLSMRRMGADGQHVKLALRDKNGKVLQMLAFNTSEEFTTRSEERRVGKECRSRWSPYH